MQPRGERDPITPSILSALGLDFVPAAGLSQGCLGAELLSLVLGRPKPRRTFGRAGGSPWSLQGVGEHPAGSSSSSRLSLQPCCRMGTRRDIFPPFFPPLHLAAKNFPVPCM